MSFSSLTKKSVDVSYPTLRTAKVDGTIAVGATKVADSKSVETSVYLTEELAAATGFRKGTRVVVLRGTGRDSGKVRIIANKKGSLKIGEAHPDSEYSLRIRTRRLLKRARNTKSVQVTSWAKGALTISI